MPQRHVQAIYQALPDKNVPLGSYALAKDYVQQQGRRLIGSFDGHTAHWALLVARSEPGASPPNPVLAAVFTAPPRGVTPLRLQSQALQDPRLQDSSERFLRTLLAAIDLSPCQHAAVWLLVSANEVPGAVPPLLCEIPGMLPGHVDVSGLPRDQFLAKLAVKFRSPPEPSIGEMAAELQKRLDIVMSLTSGDSGSLQSLISDEFKRGVAFALGSQYGYSLEGRIDGPLQGVDSNAAQQTAPRRENVEWLVHAAGFSLLVGEELRPLADQLAAVDGFVQIRDWTRRQFGFDIPEHKVHTSVAAWLPPRRAQLLFRDAVLAQMDVPPDRWLVRGARQCLLQLGLAVECCPVDNTPLAWADEALAEQARELRCEVLAPHQAALGWMRRAVFVDPCAFFSTQSAQQLLHDTQQSHPALVEECLRLHITARWVRRVAHLLLRQRIALHDRVNFLEALLDQMEAQGGPQIEESKLLPVAAAVRRRLRFGLQTPWLTPAGKLPVLRLRSEVPNGQCKQRIAAALGDWPHSFPPVLLVPEALLEQTVILAASEFPLLPVLGEHEVAATIPLFPSYDVAL